jgi:hypothetical protein
MRSLGQRTLPFFLLVVTPVAALAQSLPTSQPAFIRLIREDVKPGRTADHEKLEAGWPAAFERAKSTDFYLAMESMTNNEAWFLVPFTSYAAYGESLTRERDPGLAPELARLSRADGDLINSVRTVELRARPELSHGAFPDLAKQRYWEVTVFRMRQGGSEAMAQAAKVYAAAMDRAGNKMGFRVYEVLAGMPAPTYFIFSSVTSFGDFDKLLAEGEATMKAMTADDAPTGKKFDESLMSSETFRMQLSPEMSYVPKDVRASDPGFWKPRAATAKPAAAPKPAQ